MSLLMKNNTMKNFVTSIAALTLKFFRMIGILLIFLVIGLTMERCCRCPKTKSFEYSISSLSVEQLDHETLIWLMNKLQQAGNPIEFRKDFGVVFLFETASTVIANSNSIHSFFIQSAYACDCEAPTHYPKESITSIKVFSDKDFGETHPAGTNISDFFKIEDSRSQLTSFENYLEYFPPSFDGGVSLWFRCLVTATTIEAGEYDFTFVVELTDERIFEQSIKAVLE